MVTGALVGLVWGVAQYLVLRLHARPAGVWIVASTMIWTIAFPWLYFAAFLPDRTMNWGIHIVLGAGAGLVVGILMGLLQRWVLARLRPRLLIPHISW
jgi:hypothetical protein